MIHDFLEFLKSLYNAEKLLGLVRMLLASPLGVAGLFAIVFAETGLLIGFFLPGDSLLFSVGVASGKIGDHLTVDSLIETADNALYVAKREGRNRVEFRLPKAA